MTVEKIALILYMLSCITLIISVLINIYTIRMLEKSRYFLYFAWDLVNKDISKDLASKLIAKVTERAIEKHTADIHAVGGTD